MLKKKHQNNNIKKNDYNNNYSRIGWNWNLLENV